MTFDNDPPTKRIISAIAPTRNQEAHAEAQSTRRGAQAKSSNRSGKLESAIPEQHSFFVRASGIGPSCISRKNAIYF